MFTLGDSREIALSRQRSAEASARRKADPFRSAMSMLNFYINRAGSQLDTENTCAWKQPRTSCTRSMAACPLMGTV